ncbi:hypothetical protein VTI74DRAFT_4823 [Chaetomium olivicolor]
MMNQRQMWSSDGSSQAPDDFQRYMVPPTFTSQALPTNQHGSWGREEEQGYALRFDGPSIYPQYQKPVCHGGLPSPALTGTAASPTEWPKQDVPSDHIGWTPTSPISPTLSGCVNGGFNNQLNTTMYAPGTASSPLLHPAFYGWAVDTTCHSAQSAVSPAFTATPVTNPGLHQVPEHVNTPWTGQLPHAAQINAPGVTVRVRPQTNWVLLNTAGHANHSISAHAYPTQTEPTPAQLTQHRPKKMDPAQAFAVPPKPLPLALSSRSHKKPNRPQTRQLPTTNHNPAAPTGPGAPPPETIPVSFSPSMPSSTGAQPQPPPSPPPGPSLRTATRRFKRPPPSPRPGESPAHQRARTNHNLVEQQYRHRLHARFEALLDVLPTGILDGDGGTGLTGDGKNKNASGGGTGDRRKRMSKVDVLAHATRTIKALEGSIERVTREVEELRREREAVLGRRTGDRDGEGR